MIHKSFSCRKPTHGVNFVIAHDGFTLYDLVAYNQKHNDANGEMMLEMMPCCTFACIVTQSTAPVQLAWHPHRRA